MLNRLKGKDFLSLQGKTIASAGADYIQFTDGSMLNIETIPHFEGYDYVSSEVYMELEKPDLDLKQALYEVAQDKISLALTQSGGNKTLAAKKLGLNSYQTLQNWLKRLKLD